ncbi:MAG: cupin domain-containing protein [Verrucomicrobiales bacterium]|nr:cupin domain-containing protein [Verrucomicrobiales bacterium]
MNETPDSGHLFAPIDRAMPVEVTEILAQGRGPVRIERIVSRGHASPEGFWYDQAEEEWVALLSGSATVRFSDHHRALLPGDWLRIPARCRHRVEATDAGTDTVWLAVFFAPPSQEDKA